MGVCLRILRRRWVVGVSAGFVDFCGQIMMQRVTGEEWCARKDTKCAFDELLLYYGDDKKKYEREDVLYFRYEI